MRKNSIPTLAFCSTVLSLILGFVAAATPQSSDSAAGLSGVRKLSSRHLTLYTDLPPTDDIDALPKIFELAIPQWRDYFGASESAVAEWRQTVCLMKDKTKFAAAGLLPADLPAFKSGYTIGDRSWLFNPSEEFYRRELFLHECTHGFMHSVLRCHCPAWYMEGTAEYFGTHRWDFGRLTLGYMPKSVDESLGWGRVRLIQRAVADRHALRFPKVLELPGTLQGDAESYAWYWAAVTLLDRHPRYQKRFRELAGDVRQPKFDARFRELFKHDWAELCEEWQVMLANMDYGYDVARSAIDFTPGKIAPAKSDDAAKNKSEKTPGDVVVAADRGWQNTGLRLEAGVTYRIVASGRFQVAKTAPKNSRGEESGPAQTWESEANGVSIRYYHGLPLGTLLGAIRPDAFSPDGVSALVRPAIVGLDATVTPEVSGTLFLKINDSAGELDDNAGELKVSVRQK